MNKKQILKVLTEIEDDGGLHVNFKNTIANKLSSTDKVMGTLEVYGSDVMVNLDAENKDGEYLIVRVRDGE